MLCICFQNRCVIKIINWLQWSSPSFCLLKCSRYLVPATRSADTKSPVLIILCKQTCFWKFSKQSFTGMQAALHSECVTASPPQHHWQSLLCLNFQPYVQGPFSHFEESVQLLQEIFTLDGALTLKLPLIWSSFFFVKLTVNSYTPWWNPTTAVLIPLLPHYFSFVFISTYITLSKHN